MIEVNRNSIIIRNVDFTSNEYMKFVKAFSIYDTIYHKFTSSIITTINKDIFVPASIGIESIRYYFPKKPVTYNNIAANTKEINFKCVHTPRNLLQEESIKFLNKLKFDNYNRQRFLSLPTGSGKTFITIMMASIFKVKTMVVVDKEQLATQWKNNFLLHSNINKERIKILSGMDSVEDAKAHTDDYDIYIAIHRTLGMLIEKDPNSLNNLNNKLGIGFRVFDEAHTNFKNICTINALSNVEYTLYLTATPSRSNFRENTLYGKVFRKIPYFNGLDQKEIGRYINVAIYKYTTSPDDKTKISCQTPKGFSAQLWGRWVENGGYEAFLNTVKDIFTKFKLIEQNTKTAIVLPTINLINKLKIDLDEFLNLDCGLFIGQGVTEEARAEALNKLVFITNPKMFGEAIDVQDLEVLINFVPFTSEVRLEQLMGRIRYGEDKSHVYIDAIDVGFNKMKTQLYARKKFYQKTAKSIKEMKI